MQKGLIFVNKGEKMYNFKEWINKRRLKEALSVDGEKNFDITSMTHDNDFAQDNDHLEFEIFKLIKRKFPEDMRDFFDTLTQKGDNEINSLIKKFHKTATDVGLNPEHPEEEKDEISPSSADSGYGFQ